MKKILLAFGSVALLASPSLFAVEDDSQERLRAQENIQEKYKYKNSDEMENSEKNQYKHQYKYQNKKQQQTGSTNRLFSGSSAGQRSGSGGGRH